MRRSVFEGAEASQREAAAAYGDQVRYELRWGSAGLAEFFAGLAWHSAGLALAEEEVGSNDQPATRTEN